MEMALRDKLNKYLFININVNAYDFIQLHLFGCIVYHDIHALAIRTDNIVHITEINNNKFKPIP